MWPGPTKYCHIQSEMHQTKKRTNLSSNSTELPSARPCALYFCPFSYSIHILYIFYTSFSHFLRVSGIPSLARIFCTRWNSMLLEFCTLGILTFLEFHAPGILFSSSSVLLEFCARGFYVSTTIDVAVSRRVPDPIVIFFSPVVVLVPTALWL